MIASDDLDPGAGLDRRLTLRENDPRNPACPRHLKRICGVCTHFAGTLDAEDPAACAAWQTAVTAGRNAAKCHRFARRVAP